MAGRRDRNRSDEAAIELEGQNGGRNPMVEGFKNAEVGMRNAECGK